LRYGSQMRPSLISLSTSGCKGGSFFCGGYVKDTGP